MGTNKIKSISENSCAWMLFLVLWFYLILRSIYTPILHDEIGTFYFYYQSGVFLPPNAHWDAGNHLLNSFLSILSYRTFGSSPLALRLPNVLSFGLYFYAAWQLAKQFKSFFIRWGFLLSMCMAHYMFEYFGETRGYGLSMAFLLWGLVNYFKLIEKRQLKHFGLTILAMLLATSANLTLITSTLLFLGALGLYSTSFWQQKKTFFTQVSLLLVGLVLLFPLILFSLELKKRGALYYGGKSDFWHYTIESLSQLYFGSHHFLVSGLLVILFTLIGITTILFLFKKRPKLNEILQNKLIFISFLLIFSIIAILVMHYLLGINFPEDRTAMYLFPYFIGALAFGIDFLQKNYSKNWIWLGVLFFFLPIRFISMINIHTASFSMEERVSEGFFEYIHNAPRKNEFPHTVGGYRTQEFCWNYMSYQNGGTEGTLLTSNHIDTLADFEIIDQKRTLPNHFNQLYHKVKHDIYTHLNLYERNKSVKQTLLYSADSITTWGGNSTEFYEFIRMEIPDSLIGKPLYVTLKASIFSLEKPFEARLVATAVGKENETLEYQNYVLNWQKKDWNVAKDNLTQGIIIPNLPKGSKTLLFYIWNLNKVSFSVNEGNCNLYLLENN